MIQTNLLRGKMAENGYSAVKLAKALKITPKTFYNKMARGVFGSDEIYQMIELLNIQNPIEIFFAPEIAQHATLNQEEQDAQNINPN